MEKTNAYHRKDGRWEARLPLGVINGKRQSRSFYVQTKEEAENRLFRYISLFEQKAAANMKIGQLAIEWLHISSSRVKLSTLSNYRMKVEKHIIPEFGEMMCTELTSRTAYIFIDNKLKTGLSARYVSDIIILLKSIFKYACREYGMANPFEGIDMTGCGIHANELMVKHALGMDYTIPQERLGKSSAYFSYLLPEGTITNIEGIEIRPDRSRLRGIRHRQFSSHRRQDFRAKCNESPQDTDNRRSIHQ